MNDLSSTRAIQEYLGDFVSGQVVNQYLSEWHSRGWVSPSPRQRRVTDREVLAAVAASGGVI